ncbi:hypothetical protein V6N11_065464 [Hibiscus sabdariffa]|uniref:Thiamine pyrophosphate enzyme central domain-containing protein n=1 Tax=Hibiscus sabdariffa TaxID=183260 RepID=A0ABR2PHU1_9ROSI
MLDSIPVVAITGQVPRRMIGTDAFQETLVVEIVRLISESKRPGLYVGGGCLNSNPLSLQVLGMHGTVYAKYVVDKSDLLLVFGVQFDDRVTGKLEAFASRAKLVRIDIDSTTSY